MNTTHQRQRGKEPVNAVLAGPYGHPWHPLLVTVPIGSWVASVVFDVASWFVQDPTSLADGARWLIGLGVLGALAAAFVGLLDLFALPPGTRAFRLGLWHLALNSTVIVGFALDFAWRQAGSAPPADPWPFVLSVLALVVLGISGALGGRLAFHYGVRVADESTQAAGFVPPGDAAGLE